MILCPWRTPWVDVGRVGYGSFTTMIEATAANKVVVNMLTNIFRFQLQVKLSLAINLIN